MAVDNPNMIDAVGTHRERGDVVLSISDHLPWDESNNHLAILQVKLNRYFDFIEDGQLAQEYPIAKPCVPVRIEVVFKYSPSHAGLQFLNQVREVAEKAGWQIAWYRPQTEDIAPPTSPADR